jgi:hypothetical protein
MINSVSTKAIEQKEGEIEGLRMVIVKQEAREKELRGEIDRMQEELFIAKG